MSDSSRTPIHRRRWIPLALGFTPALSYALYNGYLVRTNQRERMIEFNLALIDTLSSLMPYLFAGILIGGTLLAAHSATSSTD